MRRFFRFRLNTLFVVVTVLIVVLGNWLYRVRQQELAVEAIEEAGGPVSYECEVEAKANRRERISDADVLKLCTLIPRCRVRVDWRRGVGP